MGNSLPPVAHCLTTQVQSGKALVSRLPRRVDGWVDGWWGVLSVNGVGKQYGALYVAVMVFLFVLSASLRSIPVSLPFLLHCHLPFQKASCILHLCCFALWRLYEYVLFKLLKKRDPLFFTALKHLLCYSPKNWFRLFKGLFFTVLSPCVDARQAQLIFSEFEVIVLNWQTKHLSPQLFHFYRVNSFRCTNAHVHELNDCLSLMIFFFFFWFGGFLENLLDFHWKDMNVGARGSLSYHYSLCVFEKQLSIIDVYSRCKADTMLALC